MRYVFVNSPHTLLKGKTAGV